jgi:uncharacterized surface protein with fasciclin (FAS1) repeats
MILKSKIFSMMLVALAALGLTASSAVAQNNPMVGGAAMYRNKDIIDNAVNSADHTTLVAAVKAADLVGTLKGKGPFTVFAPTNAAFDKLPAGTVDTLLKPENKEMLTRVLTYHVVAGKYDGKKLMSLVKQGGGTATLKTVSGGMLTFTMGDAMMGGNMMNDKKSKSLMVRDEKGGTSNVTISNVYQSNGVIHVVDTVLMPGM